MKIDEKLQIILITYNRAEYVKKALKQFFYDGSPVLNCSFLVLDNNSSDNTKEVVEDYMNRYSNIKYIKNRYNLGISGNIARAMEIAEKDYVWIVGDDDNYDFSNWQEVESAIERNEQAICVSRYAIPEDKKEDKAYQLLQMTFISGCIFNTSLFNDTVIRNVFDNIYTLFPHICPLVQFINNGGNIYVVNKAISDNGMDMEKTDYSYTRGCNNNDLYERTRSMCWMVGYCNALSQLKDKNLKENCINVAIVHEHIYQNEENFYNHMKTYHNEENFMQFIDVYMNVSKRHKNRLKTDYLQNPNSNKFNIAGLSVWMCFTYILKKILHNICSMEKTFDTRTLTILGIKIKTKRKHAE